MAQICDHDVIKCGSRSAPKSRAAGNMERTPVLQACPRELYQAILVQTDVLLRLSTLQHGNIAPPMYVQHRVS